MRRSWLYKEKYELRLRRAEGTPRQSPSPSPMASAPPPSAPSAVWQVQLGGVYVRYEDGAVQSALEAAFSAGAAEAEITVRGTQYVVRLDETPMRSEKMRQLLIMRALSKRGLFRLSQRPKA